MNRGKEVDEKKRHSGTALREAALGKNIQVVRTLLQTPGIQVNLPSKSELVQDLSFDYFPYR